MIGKDTHRYRRQVLPGRREPLDLRESGANIVFNKQSRRVHMEPISSAGSRSGIHMSTT